MASITADLTPRPINLTITPLDLHSSTVHQPLRTDDSSAVQFQEQVNKVNEQVFNGLLNDFNKSQTKGYFQSHPYDQIFTAQDLANDEWTLSNNYMRLIFGGKPDLAAVTCVQSKAGGRAGLLHALVQRNGVDAFSVRIGGRTVTSMSGTLRTG